MILNTTNDTIDNTSKKQSFWRIQCYSLIFLLLFMGILYFLSLLGVELPLYSMIFIQLGAMYFGVSIVTRQHKKTTSISVPVKLVLKENQKTITYKEADTLYDIKQIIKNNNRDTINREYSNSDLVMVYHSDTKLEAINWKDKIYDFGGDRYVGIIIDGNLELETGIIKNGFQQNFLLVTKNLKASFVQNYDTLIHVDGDLFISNYIYGDSWFGYIQSLGQIYAPCIISDGQSIEAQTIYSEKRIDVSEISSRLSHYNYAGQDLVEEVINIIDYQKDVIEVNEDQLISFLEVGKPILKTRFKE